MMLGRLAVETFPLKCAHSCPIPEVSEGCFHIKAIGKVESAAAPDEHGAMMAKIAILHLAHYE